MPRAVVVYVRCVEAINRVVGRIVMLLVLGMIGMLLWSSISRTAFNMPLVWVVEMAQFTLAAYYILGGAYAMQLGAHVRMDLFYAKWTPRRRAFADSITVLCLIFYLTVLLMGGIGSTQYAIAYGQKNYSAWAPPLAPIKVIMTVGILLMLLQAVAVFLKDLARYRGRPIDGTAAP